VTTDDELTELQRRESDEAWRRAAHLVGLLAVDDDHGGFTAAIGRFAAREDTIFATAVTAACAKMVAELLAPHPLETRRAVLMSVIAQHASFDLDDIPDDLSELDDGEDPT
jgi:ferric-dicitrate binding protein FerR (iron transport regulator)